MSALTSIPKATVEGAIRVGRLPIDALTAVAPERLTDSIELAVDSADASIRNAAGTVLSDDELRTDASRLRESVRERRRARSLRAGAGQRAEVAAEEAERARAEAAEREHRAEREAERKRERANRRRAERKQRAEQAEETRKLAARERAEQAEDQAEERADEGRLEALQAKVQSLEKGERAIAEARESDRLKHAAERAKEERRSEEEKTGTQRGVR